MSPTNINKDTESIASAARSRRGWRTRTAIGGALVAVTVVTVGGMSGVASAATGPTTQVSFSSAKISTGTQPALNFASQAVPSGSVLYLQESADGGLQWTTVGKTTAIKGTADLAALAQGVYQFRAILTDNGKDLAVSAPATLTVTAPAAPSGSGVPWLKIVKIAASILGWLIALF